MPIQLNADLLNKMFDTKDTARFGGQNVQKDTYLTEGPGAYVLELKAYKTGTGEGEKRYGQTYIVFEFEVIEAYSVKFKDGEHEPTHKPGGMVSVVKYLSGRISTKEAVEYTAVLIGTPPALVVPDGEHEGQILPMIDSELMNRCAEDDGAAIMGTKVWCNVVGRVSTKGEHAGKTFHNAYLSVLDNQGKQGKFPTWAELIEAGVNLDAMVIARFGSR